MPKQPQLNNKDDGYEEWAVNKDFPSMNKVLDHYKDVISSSVHTYAGQGASPAVQEKARIMAAKAVQQYNPKQKVPLNAFIRQQLQPLYRYANQKTVVKIPERAYADLKNIQQAELELQDNLGRSPSVDEIADYSHISAKRINMINKKYRPHQFMESFFDFTDDEDSNVHVPATQTFDYKKAWADYVYQDLEPIDKKIYEWRTAQTPLSNIEIAKRLKMSPSAVSQRAANITKKLEANTYGSTV